MKNDKKYFKVLFKIPFIILMTTIILLNIMVDTGILPKSFHEKLLSFYKLFYPNHPLGIFLFSLIVLYVIARFFKNIRKQRVAVGNNRTIRLEWYFAAFIILGLAIGIYFMYS